MLRRRLRCARSLNSANAEARGSHASTEPDFNSAASCRVLSTNRYIASSELAKWVPTSTEHLAQTRQAEHVAARIVEAPQAAPAPVPALTAHVDVSTGELLDDPDVTVEEPPGWAPDAA